MSRRAFLLIVLALGLIIAGLVSLRGELLALALPFILFLLAGLAAAPGEIDLEIRRSLENERAASEKPVEVRLNVRNHGSRLEQAVIRDVLPQGLRLREGSNTHVVTLPPGQASSWTYSISGGRGYHAFSTVEVEAGDPFGILTHKQSIPLEGQLFIQPPAKRIKPLSIRPRRTNVYSGTIPAHLGGSGVEFFGVRDYAAGDPPAWINWKVSARHPGSLYSNEFDQERVADVGIVLDGRVNTNVVRKGHSLFEYSVEAAASLADAFLAQGNRVGLLLYGHFLHWTYPGYGKLQRERVLQALARAETGDSLVFSDLGNIPTRLFPAHSQIVLVSPLSAGDYPVLVQLRARGYSLMLISPDPVGFELGFLPADAGTNLAGRIVRMERLMLLKKLTHAGVQVVDWDVRKPFDQINLGALRRPPAWLRAIGR